MPLKCFTVIKNKQLQFSKHKYQHFQEAKIFIKTSELPFYRWRNGRYQLVSTSKIIQVEKQTLKYNPTWWSMHVGITQQIKQEILKKQEKNNHFDDEQRCRMFCDKAFEEQESCFSSKQSDEEEIPS